MSTLFTAQIAVAEDDGEAMFVYLADKEFGTEHYIDFQKMHNPSEDDRRLGHDRVYIEVDEQSRASYGGIEGIQLSETKLEIYLSEKAARAVKLPIHLSVGLAPNLPPFTEMLAKMQLPIRKGVSSHP